jgi:SagB-type dehydrogenase family enzyme
MYLASRSFRQYRQAPRIALPGPQNSDEPLSVIMNRRRSARALQGAITLSELATILQQSLGPTAVVENKDFDITQALRAWPSAGGLYPIDTYVIAARVVDFTPGLYHYNVITNELEYLSGRSPELMLRDGFFWQEFVTSAAVVLLFVAVFERTITKYGERGYRLVLLDAGHAAQNVLLTAEQLRIGAVAVGGFCDDSLAADLGIDGISEAVVHSVVLGRSQ